MPGEQSYSFIKYQIKVLIIASKCNERAYLYACVGDVEMTAELRISHSLVVNALFSTEV